MAGKLRYWKEKDGRFYARIAVPKRLQPYLDRPRGELVEPIGADRRTALRLHPAAVARLQHQIAVAEQRAKEVEPALANPAHTRATITTADFRHAVWHRYRAALEADEAKRAGYPGNAEVAAEREKLMQKAAAGEIGSDPLAILDASIDFLSLQGARCLDQSSREARLAALQRELAAGETHQVEHEIDAYLEQHGVSADRGTAERAVLATHMMRAQIEAMRRTLERDAGDYSGRPADPLVSPPPAQDLRKSVNLTLLWQDYRRSRIQAGFMRDGGKRQEPVICNLCTFLGHDDARQVTRKDLIAWRDHLMNEKKLSPKTVSDIYLSAVRSVFSWAHENERLPENVAEKVRQPKPRRVDSREKGYTDTEAIAVLRASRSHVPKPNQFGYVRETPHMTAAKHWAPLLAAFTGARISEITQLRKEDIREEGECWVARITPDAGSVKSGGYRDVPLHRQVIALGFLEFVEVTKPGPLFHGADDPKRYAIAAQSVSDELAKWLRGLKLVPEGVRPNYGWRHRLKTQARTWADDARS